MNINQSVWNFAGTAMRTIAATNMNASSSRAHTLVTIAFDQITNTTSTRLSSLINFVDLAGESGLVLGCWSTHTYCCYSSAKRISPSTLLKYGTHHESYSVIRLIPFLKWSTKLDEVLWCIWHFSLQKMQVSTGLNLHDILYLITIYYLVCGALGKKKTFTSLLELW